MAAPARDSFRRFSVCEIHSPMSTSLSRSTPVFMPISWKLSQHDSRQIDTNILDLPWRHCLLRPLRMDSLRVRRRWNRILLVPYHTLERHLRQPDRTCRGNGQPFSLLEYVVVIAAIKSQLVQVFRRRWCLLMIFRSTPSQSWPMLLEVHSLEV